MGSTLQPNAVCVQDFGRCSVSGFCEHLKYVTEVRWQRYGAADEETEKTVETTRGHCNPIHTHHVSPVSPKKTNWFTHHVAYAAELAASTVAPKISLMIEMLVPENKGVIVCQPSPHRRWSGRIYPYRQQAGPFTPHPYFRLCLYLANHVMFLPCACHPAHSTELFLLHSSPLW